jgi:hypothetical protein
MFNQIYRRDKIKMGWQVISFISIDLWKESEIITKELSEKIDKILKDNDALDVEINDTSIYFKLDGNKGVDYSPVDKIKKLLLKAKLKFCINASEYVESEGEGYYFDTDEKENK